MKVKTTVKREVDVKTISFSAKCSDLFSATLLGPSGEVIAEYQGYVPGFFPEDHYGDYVQMEVDLETGVIKNWVKPTAEQLVEFMEGSGARRWVEMRFSLSH